MTDFVVARLDGVSHRYGATVALDDVTIEIPARKMVGVIGPDGVGKIEHAGADFRRTHGAGRQGRRL